MCVRELLEQPLIRLRYPVVWALLAMRSSRRAHRGGWSKEGKTQAMFARRQFEHGDVLSHRTLRVRHVTQLRSLGAGGPTDAGVGEAVALPPEAPEFAFFSEADAETGMSWTTVPPEVSGIAAENVTAGTCDMLVWNGSAFY